MRASVSWVASGAPRYVPGVLDSVSGHTSDASAATARSSSDVAMYERIAVQPISLTGRFAGGMIVVAVMANGRSLSPENDLAISDLENVIVTDVSRNSIPSHSVMLVETGAGV